MNATSPVRRLLGTPPIHPLPFLLAKLSLVVLVVAPLLQLFGFTIRQPLFPWAQYFAFSLAIGGLVILSVASRTLGSSLRVGLPAEETSLKTTGIYANSRHPIYAAIFMIAIAASVYCPHPVVLAAAVIAIVTHHFIALAEEAFLERRFGSAWLEHKKRVPRYFGFRFH